MVVRLFCCILFLPFAVLADVPLVFQNEYVVVRRSDHNGLRSDGLNGQRLADGIVLFRTNQYLRADSSDSDERQMVKYSPETDACGLIKSLDGVVSCTPNYVVRVQSITPAYSHRVRARAQDFYASDINDRVIAVLDTGMDYTHPEIRDFVWSNPFEIPGNGIDDDRNGFVDDIHGANLFSSTGDPFDDNGHGTHVAGIVAKELAARNSNVKIMPIKFLNSRGLGGIAGAIRAIDYLLDLKRRGVDVRVSNNSWGGAPYSDVLKDTVERVLDAGIVFVAAAGNVGNDNDKSPEYPASFNYPQLVSVAAVDDNGNLASFSNYGGVSVDVAAAGVRIKSAFPGGGERSMSGTSMAAPLVAGLLALETERINAIGQDAVNSLYSKTVAFPALKGLVQNSRLAIGTGQSFQTTKGPTGKSAAGAGEILLQGISPRGAAKKFVRSRFQLSIQTEGLSDGIVPVSILVDGKYECEQQFLMNVDGGVGAQTLVLPRIHASHRFLSVNVSSLSSKISIRKRNRKRKYSRSRVRSARRLRRSAKRICRGASIIAE